MGKETVVACKVKEGGLEAVQSRTASMPGEDHCLHVVVQDPARHAFEPLEGVGMAGLERVDGLVGDKLHIAGWRVAQGGHEGGQWVAPLAGSPQFTWSWSPGAVSNRPGGLGAGAGLSVSM